MGAVDHGAPERRVKDRLRRYSDLLDEIDMQRQRLDLMRADMGGVKSPSYDGMPKGSSDPDGVHRMAWDEVTFAMYGDRTDYLEEESEYRHRVYKRHTEAVLSFAPIDANEVVQRRLTV